jgi:fatty-acyl-CoA synthase/long-chain acyl-CoA synthetase
MPQLLTRSYWPADTSAPLLSMTAGHALCRAAEAAGERTALVEVMPAGASSLTGAAATDRRWTYAELLDDAETCARWLLSRFEPGEHICLWAPNVPEWVIIQYGAALAGLMLVTANPALRDEELRHVLRRSRAAGLIHAAAHRGSDMAAIAGRLAGEVRQTILLQDLASLLASFRTRTSLPGVAPRSPAQIQFTSGTTGLPKGALLHHEGLVTNAALLAARFGQDHDIVVTPMPLFHTAGSVLGVLGCVTTLSTLVLPVVFDPKLMLSSIAAERATLSSGVPTMLSAMLEELKAGTYDLSSLRVMLSGGSPVAPDLHRRVEARFGCPLVTLYGQTELSPAVCATSPDDAEADRAETSGRPLPQVEVRIASPSSGDVVPIGDEGEIQARGYQTMLGYFGQPEATAATVLEEGWLKTGDVGTMDARGYIRVTGRLSDMVIRGGENLYPAEIEAALMRHPAIAEVAVFGLSDPHWGETLAAALRLKPGVEAPEVQDLRRHCRDLLAPQKTPADWFIVDALPLTASGKVQKFALREQASTGMLTRLALEERTR